MACDLRVATPAARFGIPAARLGLMVDHWTIQRLSLLAGAGPARAMLLGAETYSGEDAAAASGSCSGSATSRRRSGWADEIAALAPAHAWPASKLALNRLEMPVGPGRRPRRARRRGTRAWGSEDLQEGIAAFRERRRPVFHGR